MLANPSTSKTPAMRGGRKNATFKKLTFTSPKQHNRSPLQCSKNTKKSLLLDLIKTQTDNVKEQPVVLDSSFAVLDETQLLSSSDDVDVIEESLTSHTNLKTPKSILKKTSVYGGSKRYNLRSSNSPAQQNTPQICPEINQQKTVEKKLPIEKIQTPCRRKDTQPTTSRLQAIDIEPPIQNNYLSKTKLKDIHSWLEQNENQTNETPPFLNLSTTPIRISPRRKVQTEIKKKTKRKRESSFDSSIVNILTEIYGKEFQSSKKCKTEPKKRQYGRRNINTSRDVFDITSETVDLGPSSSISDLSWTPLNKQISISHKKSINKVLPVSKKNAKLPTPKCSAKFQTPKNSAKFQTPDTKTPKRTFLSSLSASTPTSKCHPEAHEYKTNFNSKKQELVQKLFKLYNQEIFENQLPADMNFTWNPKLRGTAGFCYNKRRISPKTGVTRLVRIEFATKIIDRADRLRDTMIHELCHAAAWIINDALDAHGPIWQSWADRAMARFPELPKIKRCHNYEIASKYTYKCVGCGYSIPRHSKSIDTDKKRCGYCFCKLELLVNKKKKGKGEVPEFDTTRTIRPPTAFALFVKENYHSIKLAKPSLKHGEVMKELSVRYANVKRLAQNKSPRRASSSKIKK